MLIGTVFWAWMWSHGDGDLVWKLLELWFFLSGSEAPTDPVQPVSKSKTALEKTQILKLSPLLCLGADVDSTAV